MKKLAIIAYYVCRALSIIALISIPICFIASIWTEGWFFFKVIGTSLIVAIVFNFIGDAIDEELLD